MEHVKYLQEAMNYFLKLESGIPPTLYKVKIQLYNHFLFLYYKATIAVQFYLCGLNLEVKIIKLYQTT